MALPYVIEYLLSLRRPAGGSLVYQGGSQTVIPIVPPNSQFLLEVFPFAGDYFDIIFSSYVDPAVVPGVFFSWGQYFGSKVIEGTLTTGFMTYQLDSFIYISEAEPAITLLRNTTGLNQFYAGVAHYIAIANERDYDAVLDALKEVGTNETNRLLGMLTGAPRPPIGGGT